MRHRPALSAQERFLRTDHVRADLRARSVRGAVVTLATRVINVSLSFVSLAILARLLGKEDFGLIFTVTAVTGVVSSLRDFGLGLATLQRRDVTERQVSTLFWINVSLSIAVMVLTVALAPVIVWAYGGDARLGPVVLAYGALAVLTGLEVQHRALLLRQMQFLRLAVIELVSLGTGACAAIAAAWYGAGYWALVLQAAMAGVTRTGGVWAACGWRPGWPGRLDDVRPLLRYGGNLTLGHLLLDAARNVDKILLGRFAGQAATGIYGNAFKLLLLPANHIDRPLTNVAVAALSRLQEEPARFRAYYRKAMLVLASASMPFAVFVFVAAEPVVLVALGSQWREAVLILRILAPAALVQTLGSATSWVYSSTGRTDRQARFTAFASFVRTVAVCVGVIWGAVGVAAATSLATVGLRYWGITYCFRESPLKLRDLGGAIWRPVLAALVAGVGLFAAGGSNPPAGHPVPAVLAHLTIFSLAFVACWAAMPGGRQAVREVTGLVRDLRPVRRAEVPRRPPGSAPEAPPLTGTAP